MEKAVRPFYILLLEKLKLSRDFITDLVDNDVLNESDAERILSETNKKRKNEQFLSCLHYKRYPKAWNTFKGSLLQNGQTELLNEIDKDFIFREDVLHLEKELSKEDVHFKNLELNNLNKSISKETENRLKDMKYYKLNCFTVLHSIEIPGGESSESESDNEQDSDDDMDDAEDPARESKNRLQQWRRNIQQPINQIFGEMNLNVDSSKTKKPNDEVDGATLECYFEIFLNIYKSPNEMDTNPFQIMETNSKKYANIPKVMLFMLEITDYQIFRDKFIKLEKQIDDMLKDETVKDIIICVAPSKEKEGHINWFFHDFTKAVIKYGNRVDLVRILEEIVKNAASTPEKIKPILKTKMDKLFHFSVLYTK